MRYLNIGWDIDGVLYNITKAYHVYLREVHGRLDIDESSEAATYDWYTSHNISRPEFLAHLDDAVDKGHMFWSGDLYEYDVAAHIRKLRNLGHKVHIVTYRFSGSESKAEEATRFYLDSNEIEFDSLTFSEDKTIVPCDYFIEDHIKNYDALDAAGVKVYLMDRLYNRAENCTRRRVFSSAEYVDIILREHING